ncbi:DUF6331 family protein [Paractinoplanes atraurantiacus]|uniref:Uncharacterized protein n=1 Tax=Paractinoplanes atraurantiacus TaxID=1036182 RepID=A0A285KSW6_9ACTN|nr:DUF6331 family protein [Actinoplanes atraurantiacus]SNY75738.1 hypothetical protein SAMN05421748_1599 [Actinoplanes atraurantiacus]
MADVPAEIPSPLWGCFLSCEAECVRVRCGIDAISTDRFRVEAWRRDAGPVAVAEARRQLADLIRVVDDRANRVTLPSLNFLGAFDEGLSAG